MYFHKMFTFPPNRTLFGFPFRGKRPAEQRVVPKKWKMIGIALLKRFRLLFS